MAIALPTMCQLGAVIVMVSVIAMVPWGGLAMTTIATTTTTMVTAMMASNVAREVVGEQGGRASACRRGCVCAQIKEWQ